jgi:lipopolysaccharide transport system ATP-binding protein
MSGVAVRVERLSKVYRIGRTQTRADKYDTLRDQIASGLRALLSGSGRSHVKSSQFWALEDVSFEIKQGEVVGIIGRNGAGKSTLLKILSRITTPTGGRAQIYGRVGSLLEVGTGFHPELTGRENTFLNGAILGMTRAEIARKFDEIVAFAEIDDFVDTPVKRYSSGMYVRLAFAVAAHLEPEVLIVDEVLAVGDLAFQSKCLGKMSEVAGHGRTVLFVSHNMAAVQHLCGKAVLLEKGRVACAGNTADAINQYMRSLAAASDEGRSDTDLVTAPGRPPVYSQMLKRLELRTEDGKPLTGGLRLGAPLQARVTFETNGAVPHLDVTLSFRNHMGQVVLDISSAYQDDRPEARKAGAHTFLCDIPSLTLRPGDYTISVFLDINRVNVDRVEDVMRLTIIESNYYGGGMLPEHGFFVLKNWWKEEQAVLRDTDTESTLVPS